MTDAGVSTNTSDVEPDTIQYDHDVLNQILNEPELLDVDRSYVPEHDLAMIPRRDDSDRWITSASFDPEIARNNTVRICLASAIEMLCNVMVNKSKARQRQAFLVLSEMLVKNGLLPPTFVSDEFSSIRHQYAGAIQRLLTHCANQLAQTGSATTLASDSSARLIALRGRLESVDTLRAPSTTSHTLVSSNRVDDDGGAGQFSLGEESIDYNSDDEPPELVPRPTKSTKCDGESPSFSHDYFPSRFKRDFSESSVIGSGGFGQVLKARHSVDRCEYALKKIPFDYAQSSLCFRVLREIQMLARLHHSNIVRYYGAWFELEATEEACQSHTCVTEAHTRTNNHHAARMHSELDDSLRLASVATPSIQFESGSERNQPLGGASSSTSGSIDYDEDDLDRASPSLRSTNAGSSERLALVQHKDTQHQHCWPPHMPLVNQFVVYIQMQLGTGTLHDYLKRRNVMETFGCVNSQFNQRVLYDLLNAVDYIHSNGLIHRDIKPGNIFLHGVNYDQVLLGDFGLACYDDLSEYHSSGLGTLTYAAPEQLTSTTYTQQVDIYSVGIVAFELYRPLCTNMQKVTIIQQLKRGIMDEKLTVKFPIEAGIISRCVDKSAINRPTAKQLIEGNWFSASNQLLESLKSTVDSQRETIDQLTDLLKQNGIELPSDFKL